MSNEIASVLFFPDGTYELLPIGSNWYKDVPEGTVRYFTLSKGFTILEGDKSGCGVWVHNYHGDTSLFKTKLLLLGIT